MTVNHNENADDLLIQQKIIHSSWFYCIYAAKSSKCTFIMLGIGHVNSTCRNDTLIAVSVNMRIITVFLSRFSFDINFIA